MIKIMICEDFAGLKGFFSLFNAKLKAENAPKVA